MTITPEELLYVKDHHWIQRLGNGTIRMGITDFAQESLGDVVAVGLPRLGTSARAGYAFGEIESTKSVNDLVAPVSGTFTAVNDTVADQPELTNIDPYGAGWLVEIETALGALDEQLALLLDAGAYRRLTGR